MTRSLLIVAILALFGSLTGAPAALAQDAATASTITTTGSGEASAAAESADLQFLVASADAFFGGPPLLPQAEATPGAATQAAVAPIADAIAASDGVESVSVVVSPILNPYTGPPALARIDVMVTNPDQVSLSSLVTAAAQAAVGERLLVSSVGAMFHTSDCQALEQAAREAALDDARSRAQVQAEVLGVALGDVVATRDVGAPPLQAGFYGTVSATINSCEPEQPVSSIDGSTITLPRFDPTSNTAEVEIYRTVEVTFTFTASEATPAA